MKAPIYLKLYSNYLDVKFQKNFECPQGNANNYSIKDLDEMLSYKHYLNGCMFLLAALM